MKILEIKKLALSSYSNGKMNESKVLKVANLLKRSDLRAYLQVLRLIQKKNTVKIILAGKLDKSSRNNLNEIFKQKNIIIEEDPNLIAGLKIEDFDNVYEFNLKNTFKNIVNFISN